MSAETVEEFASRKLFVDRFDGTANGKWGLHVHVSDAYPDKTERKTPVVFDFEVFFDLQRELMNEIQNTPAPIRYYFIGINYESVNFKNAYLLNQPNAVWFMRLSNTFSSATLINPKIVTMFECENDDFPKFQKKFTLDLFDSSFANTDGISTGEFHKEMEKISISYTNLTSLPMLPTSLVDGSFKGNPLAKIPLDSSKEYLALKTFTFHSDAVKEIPELEKLMVGENCVFHLKLPNLKKMVDIRGNVRFRTFDAPNLHPNAENVRILSSAAFAQVPNIDSIIKNLKAKGRQIGTETNHLQKIARNNQIASSIHEYLDPDEDRVARLHVRNDKKRTHGGRPLQTRTRSKRRPLPKRSRSKRPLQKRTRSKRRPCTK